VAAAAIFLSFKGPDIKGESLDKSHPDTIECLSFDWGEFNRGTSGTGGGAGAGDVVKHDLSISKYVDKASNALMQACAAGQHFNGATLTVRKGGGDTLDYLTIALGGAVFLSGYNVTGNGGDGAVPVEHIDINFQTLMMTYNQQAMTGGGTGPADLGFDFGKTAKM
jgi:type VI secretion system secreted protein Hcp